MTGLFNQKVSLGQGDGSEVELIVSGNPLYATYETVDGYPVVYDDERELFCSRARRGRSLSVDRGARRRSASPRRRPPRQGVRRGPRRKGRGAPEAPRPGERLIQVSRVPGQLWNRASPPSQPYRASKRGSDVSAIFGESPRPSASSNGARRPAEDVRRRALRPLREPRRASPRSTTASSACFCYARLVGRRAPLDRRADHSTRRRAASCATCRRRAGRGPRSRRRAASAPRSPAAQSDEDIMRTFGPNQGLLDRSRPLHRRGEGTHHPGRPSRTCRSTVTRADVDGPAQRRQLHPQRQHLLGPRVLPEASRAASSTTPTSSSGPTRSAATASSTSTICSWRKPCSWPWTTASTSTQFDSRDEDIVDALNVLYAGQTQYQRRSVAPQPPHQPATSAPCAPISTCSPASGARQPT